jgi:hypothetical protein
MYVLVVSFGGGVSHASLHTEVASSTSHGKHCSLHKQSYACTWSIDDAGVGGFAGGICALYMLSTTGSLKHPTGTPVCT